MSAVDGKAADRAESAAAPSPFPPIAHYAFISDCHTGALIAPDGGIGWLCVPRFDAPSMFGSLLDRQAGYFRSPRSGSTSRPARRYEPGTNILETTWHTPERLDRRARRADHGPTPPRGRITPHTRPPTDDDAEHLLVRTVAASTATSRSSWCASRSSTMAASARWALVGDDRHVADATGAGQTSG